jgi:hypothetical protein
VEGFVYATILLAALALLAAAFAALRGRAKPAPGSAATLE